MVMQRSRFFGSAVRTPVLNLTPPPPPPPPPPPKVSSPGFEPPTENVAWTALLFDQLSCDCRLHTCHLGNDTTERGTSKQPDKAPVTKERRCGRSPTQKTLRIIRGGGSRALDPPTRLKTHPPRPPPPLQNSSYKRSLVPTPPLLDSVDATRKLKNT